MFPSLYWFEGVLIVRRLSSDYDSTDGRMMRPEPEVVAVALGTGQGIVRF